MTKLEEKLVKIGYEFYIEITTADGNIVKGYSKEIGGFVNNILIRENEIIEVVAGNKKEIEKDLEELKKYVQNN